MSHAYVFAFHVGLGGVVALLCLAAIIPSHAPIALAFAFAWTLMAIFVFPWIYVCWEENEIRFPPWFYRGPHQ